MLLYRVVMRRGRSRALIVVSTIALSILGSSTPASACSCVAAPISDFADEFDAVFVGRQVDRDGLLITFEVDEVYHGDVGERATFTTPGNSAGCGASFTNGVVETVLVGDWDGELSVNLCSQSLTIADGELETLYGAAQAPLPIDQSRSPSVLPSGWPWILASVFVGGAIAFRFAGGSEPLEHSGEPK